MIWDPSNFCSTAWIQTLSLHQRLFPQTQGQGHHTKISSLNSTRRKAPGFPRESREQSGARRTLPTPQKGAYTTRGGAAAVSEALSVQRENLKSKVPRQGWPGENFSNFAPGGLSPGYTEARGQDVDQLRPESQTQRPPCL